ncbi:hypothetical protein ASG12_08395 [Williamsia sp. Leaf354]|uniref:hypothetical protein n=1 Tax=Williamsia sp. Leaf354 TaxID=1736349 RepID=UPI000700E976|nr:hypothetical protein [Williamsia sp. Leaf354]KQR98457.1 hypothetical protein ASG12_08395 [Williamsia sp. Leaf354]
MTPTVTCRTEYRLRAHEVLARTAWVLVTVGAVALVVLRAVDVGSGTTIAVVLVCVAGGLGCAGVGRGIPRPAVTVAADAESLYIGNEDVALHEIPLDRLLSVETDRGPATATSSMAGDDARRLTIAGHPYLQIEVARSGPDTDAVDRWQVAVVEGDPAAREVTERLRSAARPRPSRTVADAEPRRRVARVADAGTDEAAMRLWEAATRVHDEVMAQYAPYELDTTLAQSAPEVTDVRRPQVQRFQEAMDAAEALRTDAWPGDRAYADRYQQAALALRDAWRDCVGAPDPTGSGDPGA